MKQLLTFLFLISSFVSFGQYSPTTSKTQFVNGIGIGSKDTSAFAVADSMVLTIARDSNIYYKYRGYWRPIAGGSLSAYKLNSDSLFNNGYTTRARLKQYGDSLAATKGNITGTLTNTGVAFSVSSSGITSNTTLTWDDAAKNLNIQGVVTANKSALDSIQSKSSAGGKVVSNGGTLVAEWGVGGGSNFDFHGFAGYDANRSSSYTVRSFTDKGYVDSADALRVTGSGATDYVAYFNSTKNLTGSNQFLYNTSSGLQLDNNIKLTSTKTIKWGDDLRITGNTSTQALAIDVNGTEFARIQDGQLAIEKQPTTDTTIIISGRGNIDFERNKPNFASFKNTTQVGRGLIKAYVGQLGNPEANLSHNMDYSTQVHKFDDSTRGAAWIALASEGFFVQYAPPGSNQGDVWANGGYKYLISSDSLGHWGFNTNTTENLGDGILYVRRYNGMPSISGNDTMVIEGGRYKGTAGKVYLNRYNNADVHLADGGGWVRWANDTVATRALVRDTATALQARIQTKQPLLTNPVTGTGTSGQVAYWNGTSSQTGSSGLTYNGSTLLSLTNNAATTNQFVLSNNSASAGAYNQVALTTGTVTGYFGLSGAGNTAETGMYAPNNVYFNSGGTGSGFNIGNVDASGVVRFYTGGSAAGNERGRITSGGNLLWGTTTNNGALLQVAGTVTIAGAQTNSSTLNIQSALPTQDYTFSVNTAFKHSILADNFSSTASLNAFTFKVASGSGTQVTPLILKGDNSVNVGGFLTTPKIIGTSSTPSNALGSSTYVGSGASASISGNDMAGVITLTSGTGTSGTGISERTGVTVTFASAYASAPVVVANIFSYDGSGNAISTTTLQVNPQNTTTSQFQVTIPNGTTLAASTTFRIAYNVIGR